MRAFPVLRPRDEHKAAHAATVLFLAGAFLLTVYVVIDSTPASQAGRAVALLNLGALLGFAALP